MLQWFHCDDTDGEKELMDSWIQFIPSWFEDQVRWTVRGGDNHGIMLPLWSVLSEHTFPSWCYRWGGHHLIKKKETATWIPRSEEAEVLHGRADIPEGTAECGRCAGAKGKSRKEGAAVRNHHVMTTNLPCTSHCLTEWIESNMQGWKVRWGTGEERCFLWKCFNIFIFFCLFVSVFQYLN